MRPITRLQHPTEVPVEGTLFDLTNYGDQSGSINHYDLDCGEPEDPFEAYKQRSGKKNTSPAPVFEVSSKTGNSTISNSAVASEASATPSTNGSQIASALPTTATSIAMPLPSTPPTSPTCESTATSAPTFLNVGSSTSLPVDSPAPEPAPPEIEPDSTTPNQVSGEKDCESSAKSAPVTSSGSNLWELSNEDYANWLEEAEWQAILVESSESLLANLGLATSGNASSLSVPTLVTGSGTYRNAGQTKCEVRLREFGLIPSGWKFSPEGMAMMMGFPRDYFAALCPSSEPITPVSADSPNATMCVGSPVGASPQPRLESPLPSPWEDDSLRESAPTLSESSNSGSTCRSCGEPIEWGKTAAGKKCPFNLDGTSHFTTCPDANGWSRKVRSDDSIRVEASTLDESSCDLKVATAWGEFYGSENCQLWASKSHSQRWDWINMEVLELEQSGTQRLVLPYGRLPLSLDGSRPVVPAGMEVRFARPFWVEREELQPIEEDSIIQDSLSESLNRCEQPPDLLEDDSLRGKEPILSESSSRGRQKLREFADSLSEEGLRQLVRRLSESLGDDSLTDIDRAVSESSFEKKEADSSQKPQKMVLDDSIVGVTVVENHSRSFAPNREDDGRFYGEPHSDASSESYSPEPSSQSSASGKSAEPVLSSSSVGVYAPGGEARGGHEYFRLTWWDKGRSRRDPRSGTRSKHIRGGNTSKPSAISRVRKIIDAIPQGSA